MNKNLKKNTIWNTIGITFNSFNSLFFLVIINRINGVDTAGVFSFSFSIACLLYIIGIYEGRVFQVSDTDEKLSNREYLVHKLLSCLLMMGCCTIFIVLKKYSLKKNSIIFILCLYKCLEAFDETLYAYLQKDNLLYKVGKSYFYRSIFGLVFFGIIDWLTKSILLSCLVLNLNSLIFLIFYDFRNTRKYIDKEKINWKNVFNLYNKAFSLFAFSFLAVYIVNIPKYVIDIILNNSFQTIFGIIVMPGTVVSVCGQYITAPVLTDLVKLYDEKKYTLFNSMIKKISVLLFLFGVLIELIAYFLGIPILSFIYAIDLSNYKIDLLCIIFGAICYALAGILSTAMITMRKNNVQLLIYVLDAIFGMIVCYYFIQLYGIHGATLGYILTMLFHALLYIIFYRNNIYSLEKKNKYEES